MTKEVMMPKANGANMNGTAVHQPVESAQMLVNWLREEVGLEVESAAQIGWTLHKNGFDRIQFLVETEKEFENIKTCFCRKAR